MERKMFCFDLDNTLLKPKQQNISPRILNALNQLQKMGHIVVLASGRDFSDPKSRYFATQISPQSIIHVNGLKVTINEQNVYTHYFDRLRLKQVLEYGEKHGICVGATLERGAYYVHSSILRQFEIALYGQCQQVFLDPLGLLQEKVHALHVVGNEEEVRQLVKHVSGLYYYMFNGGIGADLMDVAWSKAEGIQILHDYYGMTWEDTLCFGDSLNDVSMIKKAKLGFAVENGAQELKDCADMIIKSVDEEGVAVVLENLFLVNEK